MKSERLTGLSIALAVAVAAVAFCRLDIMLVGVEAILVLMTWYPYRRDRSCYPRFLLGSSLLSSVLLLAAEALDLSGLLAGMFYGGVSVGWLLILLMMPGAAMTAGFMFGVCFNHYTEANINPRWLLVFALTFTLAALAMYLFPLFVSLYDGGYAMFNEDVLLQADKLSDRLFMAPVIAAVVTSLPWVLSLRHCAKHCEPETYCQVDRP